jgi:antitoxin StbD
MVFRVSFGCVLTSGIPTSLHTYWAESCFNPSRIAFSDTVFITGPKKRKDNSGSKSFEDLDKALLNDLLSGHTNILLSGDFKMLESIHAGKTASITEFKKNPQAFIDAAHGEAIALLNRNKTAAYIVPPEVYKRLLEMAEDIELGRIYEERKHEKANAIAVSIDAL